MGQEGQNGICDLCNSIDNLRFKFKKKGIVGKHVFPRSFKKTLQMLY